MFEVVQHLPRDSPPPIPDQDVHPRVIRIRTADPKNEGTSHFSLDEKFHL